MGFWSECRKVGGNESRRRKSRSPGGQYLLSSLCRHTFENTFDGDLASLISEFLQNSGSSEVYTQSFTSEKRFQKGIGEN